MGRENVESETEMTSTGTPRWMARHETTLAVVISAATLVATMVYSQMALSSSAEQFERTVAQSQYSDIVGGLDSPSVGVQVNAIRRLVRFVNDDTNFDSTIEQERAVIDAAQTLMVFVQDESATPGREGLSDYRDPQPVVSSRALDELLDLLDAAKHAISVDLSRVDFHGIGAADLKPRGSLYAVGADFRLAAATGWDLSDIPANLGSAFFTCANLQQSDFGQANVSGTDFTGANLRGADLGDVIGLRQEQIGGAVTGEATTLPAGLIAPTDQWGAVEQGNGHWTASPQCRALVESMTRLPSGSGFSSRLPCPGVTPAVFPPRLRPAEKTAVARVCALRTELNAR